MYIDAIRDVHIGMTKQPGENPHVDPKDMFAAVFDEPHIGMKKRLYSV